MNRCETDEPHDHAQHVPQSSITYQDVAAILRMPNRTEIEGRLSELVHDPGDARLKSGDINIDIDTLGVNQSQSRFEDEYSMADEYSLPDDLDLNDVMIYEDEDNLYIISQAEMAALCKSLIDPGANGGIAGNDMRLIDFDNGRTIDVQGIDNHQLPQLKIGTHSVQQLRLRMDMLF